MSTSEAKVLTPLARDKESLGAEELNDQVRLLESVIKMNEEIGASLRFFTLSKTIKKSIQKLVGIKLPVEVFYHSNYYKMKNCDAFYPVKMNGEPDLHCQYQEVSEDDHRHTISVQSKKGRRQLAILSFGALEGQTLDGFLRVRPYIEKLVATISATIESLFKRADEKQKLHFENELNTARLLQQTLLPQGETIVINGVEVSGFYQSATECGGDWWGCYEISEAQSLFFVGDVTGHGTASAMLCALVRGFCDSYLFRRDTSLDTFMKDLNNAVFRTSQYSQRIMTMAAVLVDEDRETLTFCNAGHNSPVLLNPVEEKPLRFLVGSGSTLGLNRGSSYKISELPFSPGSSLVMYSDGIVEAINPEGQEYGERRMKRQLKKHLYAESSAEILSALVKDMNGFREGEPLADDVTIVVIKSFGF